MSEKKSRTGIRGSTTSRQVVCGAWNWLTKSHGLSFPSICSKSSVVAEEAPHTSETIPSQDATQMLLAANLREGNIFCGRASLL